MRAAIGLAVVVLHAIAFAMLAGRAAGQDLEVSLVGPAVPGALRSRVVETSDGHGPGLVRRRWRVTYRGDHVREVGATELVGPFQDPEALACSGRVVVGQALLDQIAGALRETIEDQLRGATVFPIGAFRSIDALALAWARVEKHPLDAALLGSAGAPHGYVRATARIAFERVTVPIVLLAIPEHADAQLHVRVAASARVEVANGVLQWLNSKVDLASQLATRVANRELAAMLVSALAPPPPFELAGGQTLAFRFCADPIEIADRAYGALPFAVAIGDAVGGVRPPHITTARTSPVPPAAPASLAIELDADALNAMLFELWRTGWLDHRLVEVGLDREFNADPVVAEMLTVRLSSPRLALPPVITREGDHLRLAADARVDLRDGGLTVGRVSGTVDLRTAANHATAVTLGSLELACERTPTTLVPCYAELVAAVASRGADFTGALTSALDDLLRAIFVGRELTAGDVPFALRVTGAGLALAGTGVRVELSATLVR